MELNKENENDNIKKGRGRPKGSQSNCYKYEVTIFDKERHIFNNYKCINLDDFNKQTSLDLTYDIFKRIKTKKRVDMTMKNKENSFLARYGHITVKPIKEPVN